MGCGSIFKTGMSWRLAIKSQSERGENHRTRTCLSQQNGWKDPTAGGSHLLRGVSDTSQHPPGHTPVSVCKAETQTGPRGLKTISHILKVCGVAADASVNKPPTRNRNKTQAAFSDFPLIFSYLFVAVFYIPSSHLLMISFLTRGTVNHGFCNVSTFLQTHTVSF